MFAHLFRTALIGASALAVMAGCSHAPPTDAEVQGAWHEVTLPGKPRTVYAAAHKDGRECTAAESERSASLWRRRVEVPAKSVGEVSFSWWVQDLDDRANLADAAKEDSPARVLFAFDGDVGRLPPRTRALFDLMEAITGERPPYATLMYVWDAHAPVGTVIISSRSDRIRKIVVDSGPGQLRRWRDHRRDLAADFRRVFGEAPGALKAVALMTDSDNTASSARSWYGPVELAATPSR